MGLEADLVAEPPETSAQQLLRVDAELLEQAAVLLRVDLVWQLLIGLGGLALVSSLADELEDLFLGNLHVDLLTGRLN